MDFHGQKGLEREFDFVLWFLNRPFKLQIGPGKSNIALAVFNQDWHLKLNFTEAFKKSPTELWCVGLCARDVCILLSGFGCLRA